MFRLQVTAMHFLGNPLRSAQFCSLETEEIFFWGGVVGQGEEDRMTMSFRNYQSLTHIFY